MRLRLGERVVVIKNRMREKNPEVLDDRDDLMILVVQIHAYPQIKQRFVQTSNIEFNLHRSIVAMPHNCPDFQTQLTLMGKFTTLRNEELES